MPKAGELTYYETIGELGRSHAIHKPFSEEVRGRSIMQVGAVMELLPPPPVRILECGCGTGWFAKILQHCGYDVVGVDVAPMAIDLARGNPIFTDDPFPTFEVADSEDLPFREEFDVVLFYDSLHHSVDEQAAINGAFRALRPGGICVASETALGHEKASRDIAERYDVTEKNMHPALIARLGKKAGFRNIRTYPRADQFGSIFYEPSRPTSSWKSRLARCWPFNYLAVFGLMTVLKRTSGIVVLTK